MIATRPRSSAVAPYLCRYVLRLHGELLRRRRVAVGRLVLELDGVGRRPAGAAHAPLPAGVDGAPAHDVVGHARRHGHRGRCHDRWATLPPPNWSRWKRGSLDAERLRDHDALHAVTDAMAGDAVEVAPPQARRRRSAADDGPQRQRQRAHAAVLGEFGVTDADDRGAVAQGMTITAQAVDAAALPDRILSTAPGSNPSVSLARDSRSSGHSVTLCG